MPGSGFTIHASTATLARRSQLAGRLGCNACHFRIPQYSQKSQLCRDGSPCRLVVLRSPAWPSPVPTKVGSRRWSALTDQHEHALLALPERSVGHSRVDFRAFEQLPAPVTRYLTLAPARRSERRSGSGSGAPAVEHLPERGQRHAGSQCGRVVSLPRRRRVVSDGASPGASTHVDRHRPYAIPRHPKAWRACRQCRVSLQRRQ